MTSNLGADALVADVAHEGIVSDSAKSEVMHAVRQSFAPEFVNRIDEMVIVLSLINSGHLEVLLITVTLGHIQPSFPQSASGHRGCTIERS